MSRPLDDLPDQPERERQTVTDAQLVPFCIKAMDYFCAARNITPPLRSRASLPLFIGWLAQQTDEFMSELGATPGLIEFLRGAHNNPSTLSQIAPLWPFILIGDRPVKHPLSDVTFVAMVRWADGAIMPIRMALSAAPGFSFSDASIASAFARLAPEIVNTFLHTGTDNMRGSDDKLVLKHGEPEVFKEMFTALQQAPYESDEQRARVLALAALVKTVFNPSMS